MGYVIAGIIVLLIVAAGIAWLVMSATGRRRGDERAAIVAEDETPMGDTAQHAGEQSQEGQTVGDPESAERGVDPGGEEPAPAGGGPSRPERPEDRQLRDSGAATQSERLADRPRRAPP